MGREIGPDELAQRVRTDRRDQRDVGSQPGRRDRGVGRRAARGDLHPGRLRLLVRSRYPVDPIDEVHGGQAGAEDARHVARLRRKTPMLRNASATLAPRSWAMSAAGPGFVPM